MQLQAAAATQADAIDRVPDHLSEQRRRHEEKLRNIDEMHACVEEPNEQLE
jgi:hypothetical protein